MAEAANPMAQALVDFEKPRITDEDCKVLSVFKGQNELLLALRNVLFGIDDDRDRGLVESRLQGDEVQKVLRKIFIWEIDRTDPVGQTMDLWKTKDIAAATPEDFDRIWESKELLIEMIDDAFKRVGNVKAKKINLEPRKDLNFMIARNNFMDFISAQIRDIVMNASRKVETVEGMMERMRKDSSK